MPEEREIFANITVDENLRIGMQPARPGVPTWTVDQMFTFFPQLRDRRTTAAGMLSGGEQQMLTICRSLLGNPRVILIDDCRSLLVRVILIHEPTLHQPPQGYFHCRRRRARCSTRCCKLRERVGEFEKPKFFHYQQNICAHSRNEQVGCNACIEVCSAQAIASEARDDRAAIEVNPHLCVGCGACTTVCPTGALGYAYPRAADQGAQCARCSRPIGSAGGRDAGAADPQPGGRRRRWSSDSAARRHDERLRGVPARVIPLALWHTASIGLDLWLSAIA